MISWIKLDVNILDDAKIKIIRSHPDGNAVLVLWIGLLCLAMKSQRPGIIEIADGLPYTVDDLANLFSIDKKTVEMGLALFFKYRMVDIFDGGCIEIINFRKHQNLDEIERKRELTRVRVARYREQNRNALLTHVKRDVTITDKTKTKTKTKIKDFLSDSVEIGLSELLFSEIKKRNPKHKEPNFQSWAKHIDLMIRVDNRTPQGIKDVIKWSQGDTFWQNNILSTEKLRAKYDQLSLKMKEESGSGNSRWFQNSGGSW